MQADLIDLVLVTVILSVGVACISPVVFSAFFRAKEDHLTRLAQRLSKEFTLKGKNDGQDS
jgi:hypothetical protein